MAACNFTSNDKGEILEVQVGSKMFKVNEIAEGMPLSKEQVASELFKISDPDSEYTAADLSSIETAVSPDVIKGVIKKTSSILNTELQEGVGAKSDFYLNSNGDSLIKGHNIIKEFQGDDFKSRYLLKMKTDLEAGQIKVYNGKEYRDFKAFEEAYAANIKMKELEDEIIRLGMYDKMATSPLKVQLATLAIAFTNTTSENIRKRIENLEAISDTHAGIEQQETNPGDVITHMVPVIINGEVTTLLGKGQGIGAIIDRITEKPDGSINLMAYNTKKLEGSVGNKILMAFGNIPDTAKHRIGIGLAFQMVMLKMNNPALKVNRIEASILEAGAASQITDFSPDIKNYLKAIQQYFESTPELQKLIENYPAEVLFDFGNYIPKSLHLSTIKRKLGDHADYATVLDTLSNEYTELNVLRGLSTKADRVHIEQRMKDVFEAINEYISGGVSTYKSGEIFTNPMHTISAYINSKVEVSNKAIQDWISWYERNAQGMRKEFETVNIQHDKLLMNSMPSTGGVRGKVANMLLGDTVTHDYGDLYGWLWDENGTIINYTSPEWENLPDSSKAYADYFRHEIRFAAAQGDQGQIATFIEKELEDRTELSPEVRAKLEKQLESLKPFITPLHKGGYFSKNKQLKFTYHEGWVPRISRTVEEVPGFLNKIKERLSKNLVGDISLFDEDLVSSKDSTEVAMPLRFFKGDPEGFASGKYTKNPAFIFRVFTANSIKHKKLNGIVLYGNALARFFSTEDAINNTDRYKGNATFVENMTRVFAGIEKDTFNGYGIKFAVPFSKDEDGNKVTVEMPLHKIIKAVNSGLGLGAFAFQYHSALRRSISNYMTIGMNAVAGDIGEILSPGALKQFEALGFFGTKNVLKGLMLSTPAVLKSYFSPQEKSKLGRLSDLFGYLPDSSMSNGRIATGLGSFGANGERAMSEFQMIVDKVNDNISFLTVMYASMQSDLLKVKHKVTGEMITMYDAYEFKDDGTYEFMGEVRGKDKQTGEELRELTYHEIARMKEVSAKMFGRFRDDEKMGLQSHTISGLFMLFKRWIRPVLGYAWDQKHSNNYISKYTDATEFEVHDEKALRKAGLWQDGKTVIVKKGSDAYNTLEKLDAHMLPLMEWAPTEIEGYMRTLLSCVGTVLSLKGISKEQWNKLSPYQQRNVSYALTKIAVYATLTALSMALMGDSDEDDRNKLKRLFLQIRSEIRVEVSPVEMFEATVALPTFERTATLLSGLSRMLGSVVTGEYVETGDLKGYVKGIPETVKNIPYFAALWNFSYLAGDARLWAKDISDGTIDDIVKKQRK